MKQLGLPFTGDRFAAEPSDTVLLTCPECRQTEVLGQWCVMGACHGNVICRHCAAEVVIEIGAQSFGCDSPDCEWCA